MPNIVVPYDRNEQIDCGILSHGDVYFMTPNENEYVSSEKFTATLHDPDGDRNFTGLLIVLQVPDGAAAAAVTHLGRGGSMRLYINNVDFDRQHNWITCTYMGFRFYSLGG